MNKFSKYLDEFLRPKPKKGSMEGTTLWSPPGGMETYVHSLMSDPYGADDSEGLKEALTEENIRVARACSVLEDRIDSGDLDREEGLRLIGALMLRLIDPRDIQQNE